MISKVLLDSTVFIDILRGGRIDTIAGQDLYSSVISRIEVSYGAKKSKNSKEQINRAEGLFKDLNVTFLSINTDISDVFVAEKLRLEKMGKSIEDFDLFIGVTAVVNSMKLLTRNRKHFENIEGISIIDL